MMQHDATQIMDDDFFFWDACVHFKAPWPETGLRCTAKTRMATTAIT
jgi:hypothetical protein